MRKNTQRQMNKWKKPYKLVRRIKEIAHTTCGRGGKRQESKNEWKQKNEMAK